MTVLRSQQHFDQIIDAYKQRGVESERVLEPAAAAALDRDPKHLGLADRLLRHQRLDLAGGALRERDDGVVRSLVSDLDRGHGRSVARTAAGVT